MRPAPLCGMGFRQTSVFEVLGACPLSAIVAMACGGVSKSADSTFLDGNGGAIAGSHSVPATGGASAGGAASVSEGSGAAGAGTGGKAQLAPEPFWPDLPLGEFHAPMCKGMSWLPVHGLNPATPVDYVALELRLDFAVPPMTAPTQVDSVGTSCATAPDHAACQKNVDQAGLGMKPSEFCGGPPYPCQHLIVTTKGDSVQTYLPGQGYLDFLGPIDTPAEALLLVGDQTFWGNAVICGDPASSSVRAIADGYEVVVRRLTGECGPIEIDRVLFHVSKGGQVSELRHNVASVETGCI